MSKKFLSSLLAIFMIVTTIPQNGVEVKAMENNIETNSIEKNDENFVDYVNMYIGTKYDSKVHHKGNSEYGGTMPMVTAPFGMTNFVAQTRENKISSMSYRYEDTNIGGFIATHQPAVWMGDYGYVTMMPQIGDVKTKFNDRKLAFNRENEITTPYYYSVDMNTKNNKIISTEMTATERCAIFNFTFPEKETASMFIEASRGGSLGNAIIDVEKQKIRGYNTDIMSKHLNNNPQKNFKGYFVIEFSKPFSEKGTSKDYNISEGSTEVTTNAAGAYVSFDNPNNEVIQVKIGTSFISEEQAQYNLDQEIPDWDFDKVKNNLKDIWNEKLGTIEIEGASDDERTIFYSALYHSLLYPRMFSEYGKYYSPYDNQVHDGVSYTDYSLWDTFRAQNALVTLAAPEHVDGMVQSLLQNYQEGGYMPKWPNPYYTNIMIGTHADSVVAEAIAKGFTGFNYDLAYAAVLKDGLAPPEKDLNTWWGDRQTGVGYEARAGLTYYKALGYVPLDKTAEAASRTLEGAYDDWCIAQVAKAICNEEDYKFFINRSQNYKNLYNEEKQQMMGKNLDGSWENGGWTEGRPENYAYCVLQDFSGLVDLMGIDVYNKKLDEYFAQGKNEHDNEPSHHYGYLYNYSGRPWKTQEIVRDILEKNYRSDELGLMGNDDCGQMSSWYVFSAMGFYPVTPASGEYMIGSPIFDKVTIHMPNNKDFVVEASNNTDSNNKYIQSAKLNGENLNKPVLSHKDIANGGKAEFNMGSKPSDWASDYKVEALPTYENVQNPEDDYVSFIGDSTAKIAERNLALEAKASATTFQVVSDGGPAETLNDGKYDYGYVSANNSPLPQYLTYMWDEPQSFDRITIYSNYPKSQGVTNFILEATEDGNTWTSITDEISIDWKSDDSLVENSVKIDGVKNKLGLRMKVIKANNTWNHFAMRELEVYSSKDYVDLNDVKDIVIETKPLVNKFGGIKYKDQMLEENIDYVVDGDIITLKAGFLKDLERNKTAKIELVYNMGNNPVIYLTAKDLESAIQLKRNIAPLAKADATSYTIVSDGGTPDTLNDGNLNRGWCSKTNPEYPQYLTFTWDKPQSFNEIKLYSNYAKSQAPTNIDIEVLAEKDGEWRTAESNVTLQWTSSEEKSEVKTIAIPDVKSVYAMRIKINSAKTDWGKIAVREVEIMSNKFDVVKDQEEDINIEFELNGSSLVSIKNGDKTLEVNKDYIITDNAKVTIKDSYIKTLSKEIENLEFTFSKGSLQIVTIYTHGFVVIDKSELQNTIAEASKLEENKYTPGSWTSVVTALEIANLVNEDSKATQEEVDEAKSNLELAIKSLIRKADRLVLQIAVEEAQKVTEDELSNIVPAVVKEFKEALVEAEAILANKDATQEEVDASFDRLSKVMHMLSFKKGDKEALKSLIERINGLDEEEYISKTWDKLQKQLEIANKVVADENALEEEVMKTYEGLLKSFLDLRLKPSKDKLEELINKAESIDRDKYTEKSLKAIDKALASAKKVFSDEKVTEKEITKVEKNLEVALNSLVKKDNNEGKPGNGDNNENESNNGNNNENSNCKINNGGKLPNTGGTSAAAIGLLGIAIVTSGVFISKKKNKRK
jgi:predicted alpha-1,2-mannosidase